MRSLEEGKCYHLFNRGNNRQSIFIEDKNYAFFMNKLKQHVGPHVDLFAYCLLPNHFHLFLRIKDLESFHKGIKNFFISYTKAINKKYNRGGSLFQGKYKSNCIDEDSYFSRIITYIHQNPVRAGLAKNMIDYQYSSYPSFFSSMPSSLCRTEVLEWFGSLEAFRDAHLNLWTLPQDAENFRSFQN